MFTPALLLAIVVVVTLNAWLAFHSVTVLVRNQALVEHTWQVITQVERIMGSAKDAETGSRGYLISGGEEYLAPYTAAVRELPGEVDQLQTLTADNAGQQSRVQQLRRVLQQRLAVLQQIIDLRGRGSLADSPRMLALRGTGRSEMDNLRSTADGIEGEEHRLLLLRVDNARTSSRRTRITIAFASVLDLLLVLLALWQLMHERKLRMDTEEARQRLHDAQAETNARAEEVRALNAHLEERVEERTAELERINRELEAFSYSVSHDLRAPLRTIDGFSLALQEDYAEAVDETGRDYIRRVRTSVQRMGQLIDALLLLSRITRSEIVREPCDLTLMAQTIVAELREHNRGRMIDFVIEEDLDAFADPRLLRVVLENLLGNAVKFSSKVPHAVIRFGWDAEQKAWMVADNGAGFDMIYARKLFNAFNRLHGDKDFKGSGIGLATVSRVIHGHHGRIWADSAVDRGATFWFTLGEEALDTPATA